MTSLEEILKSPKLRQAEIVRLTLAAQQSAKSGHHLDATAYRSALQLFTDAEHGIDRCYGCGKIKSRKKEPGHDR